MSSFSFAVLHLFRKSVEINHVSTLAKFHKPYYKQSFTYTVYYSVARLLDLYCKYDYKVKTANVLIYIVILSDIFPSWPYKFTAICSTFTIVSPAKLHWEPLLTALQVFSEGKQQPQQLFI